MNRLYGVKLYDSRFCKSETVDLLQEAGFNTVYLGRDALVPAFTEELSARGLFWNIVEPVFLASEGVFPLFHRFFNCTNTDRI